MKDISIEKENIKIKDMKDSRSVKKEKGEKLFEKMTDETFPEIKTDLRLFTDGKSSNCKEV